MHKAHHYMLATAAVVTLTVATVLSMPAGAAWVTTDAALMPSVELSVGANVGCDNRDASGWCLSKDVTLRTDDIATWHLGTDDLSAYFWDTEDAGFDDRNDIQRTFGVSYKFGLANGWFVRSYVEHWVRPSKNLELLALEVGKVFSLGSDTLKLSATYENLWSAAYLGSNYGKDVRFQAWYTTTIFGQPVTFFGAANGYEAPCIKRAHLVGSISSDFKLIETDYGTFYGRPALKGIEPLYTKGGPPRDPEGNISVLVVLKT